MDDWPKGGLSTGRTLDLHSLTQKDGLGQCNSQEIKIEVCRKDLVRRVNILKAFVT